MKKITMRSLAWLASLMLLVSLFATTFVLPAQAATVNYVYSGNYVYNWGQRETLATFLSPMAEDFYEDNNVDYATLASLSGASSNSDVPYSALYDALHELMYDNLDTPTSYGDTRNLFKYTDCQNSGGSISSFYSGKSIGPEWDGGSTWNREHTWPNSKSNGGSDSNTKRETDIMMLRPASVSENSSRSNTAYGESSKFYHPNSEGNGTYDLRGDVSRIVLYVYVCWGGSSDHDGALNYMWGSSGVMESKEVLLKWMEEDPVDTWELGRNDAVEAITGTRNVFVDYPELAFLLFNETVPEDYASPSGEGASVGYSITADTNNSNYGTVSVKGSTITATPKTGYAVSGYTILSGSATVNRNGNVFNVIPTSDVSICINFAKRTQSTVRFAFADGTVTQQVAYTGDVIALPDHSGSLASGHTFVGWAESKVEDTTEMPTYYKAGENYTVVSDVVLYALYSRVEAGSGNSNVFEKYSGTITEGDYLIVYNNGAMEAAKNGSASRLDVETVSITDDKIENPAAAIVWQIAKSDSYWTLYNASTKSYANSNGTKNQLVLGASSDASLWTVSGSNPYEFTNKSNQTKGVNYTLRRNDTYGFACYSTSTGGSLTLYKRQSGTIYYFSANGCEEHEYDDACDSDCNVCGECREAPHTIVEVPAKTPTCTESGNIAYSYCTDCGQVWVEGGFPSLVMPIKLDASCKYGAVHTAAKVATCYEEGNLEYWYCANCDVYYADADCTIVTNAKNLILPVIAHVYDNDSDPTCNVCGAVRQVAAQIFTGGQTSVSEDVNGLAFLFVADVTGTAVKNTNVYVENSATIVPFADGAAYKVVRMGAVVSNKTGAVLDLDHLDGVQVLDVKAERLWDIAEDYVSFAIRVIDIPDKGKDTLVTVRPYYVYEVDGAEIVVYGDAVSSTYNQAAQ